MSQSTLRQTHQEAVIKVYGGSGTAETIDLQSLLAAGQILDTGDQLVNIVGVTWTGENASVISVERNSVRIMTIPCAAAGTLPFDGQTMPPESINNNQDIVVTITGGIGECWLKLRKVSGYKTTIEPEQFGSHDNPLVAGS